MATAKKPAKPSKSTAVSLKAAAMPANFDQEAAVAAFKNRLAVAETNKIQVTQDKHFKVPVAGGDSEKVSTVSGIIVDFASRKAYYETGFDRDNPVPPNCFAIGFTPHDALIPSENSPEVQGDACKTCALNKFTKDSKGNWIAKDCKDSYRLALLAPDDNGEGRLMTLDISSTGIREFDSYIRSLAKIQKAPYQVVTEFSFDEGKEYPSVRCEVISDVPKAALGFVIQQQETAIQLVSREPNLEREEPAAPAKAKGKALPKPAARRKAA